MLTQQDPAVRAQRAGLCFSVALWIFIWNSSGTLWICFKEQTKLWAKCTVAIKYNAQTREENLLFFALFETKYIRRSSELWDRVGKRSSVISDVIISSETHSELHHRNYNMETATLRPSPPSKPNYPHTMSPLLLSWSSFIGYRIPPSF